MACRGVFFALTQEQTEHLLSLTSDEERLKYLQDEVEEEWDEEHLLETDKAWDAIHRCLTDGALTIAPSTTPLGKLILGGRQLYSDPETYVINLVKFDELSGVSAALKAVTKEWLKSRYDQLRNTDYPQEFISPQDWEYTWDYFSGIPDFIDRADRECRSIIFTVDQ